MTNNNMNTIAKALIRNITIKDRKSARINGGLIGVDAYGSWQNALENAHTAFYKYESAKIKFGNGTLTSIKDEKDKAVEAYKSIIALIGDVNGIKLETSIEAMELVSKYSIRVTEELIGKAYTLKSELDNLKKQLDNVHTGMSEEYVSNLEKQYEAKEEELKLEKKNPGSAKKGDTMTAWNFFIYNAETRLAEAIEKQGAQPYEEILAEREAKKAANRARAKARRDANKKAQTSNQPVETVAA